MTLFCCDRLILVCVWVFRFPLIDRWIFEFVVDIKFHLAEVKSSHALFGWSDCAFEVGGLLLIMNGLHVYISY